MWWIPPRPLSPAPPGQLQHLGPASILDQDDPILVLSPTMQLEQRDEDIVPPLAPLPPLPALLPQNAQPPHYIPPGPRPFPLLPPPRPCCPALPDQVHCLVCGALPWDPEVNTGFTNCPGPAAHTICDDCMTAYGRDRYMYPAKWRMDWDPMPCPFCHPLPCSRCFGSHATACRSRDITAGIDAATSPLRPWRLDGELQPSPSPPSEAEEEQPSERDAAPSAAAASLVDIAAAGEAVRQSRAILPDDISGLTPSAHPNTLTKKAPPYSCNTMAWLAEGGTPHPMDERCAACREPMLDGPHGQRFCATHIYCYDCMGELMEDIWDPESHNLLRANGSCPFCTYARWFGPEAADWRITDGGRCDLCPAPLDEAGSSRCGIHWLCKDCWSRHDAGQGSSRSTRPGLCPLC